MIKTLTVEQLSKILENMEPDMRLTVNTVGNLKVESADLGYIGFIDFLEGRFINFEEVAD